MESNEQTTENTGADLEEMDDHQLLLTIARTSVQAERHRRVAMWALVVVAVCLVVTLIMVVPQLLGVLSQGQSALTNANDLLEQIKDLLPTF